MLWQVIPAQQLYGLWLIVAAPAVALLVLGVLPWTRRRDQ